MKFSVVVPLYNCAEYIEGCLCSLANQTFRDFEVVVVNDGSTDDSAEVAGSICARRPNMRMISQANGGLSVARNAGLRVSKGDYVLFIDADDYVEPAMLAVLDDACNGCDLVMFGYYCDWLEGGELVRSSEVAFSGRTVCECLERMDPLVFSGLVGYAWNKAYRRAFLIENDLFFLEGVSLVEDIDLNSRAITCAAGNAVLPNLLVHYVQRKGRETLSAKRYDGLAALSTRSFNARFAIFDKFAGPRALELAAPVFELILVFLLNYSSGTLAQKAAEVGTFIDACIPLINARQMRSPVLRFLAVRRAYRVLAAIYIVKQIWQSR